MRLRHRPADGVARTIASDVEVADTFITRARGLMFRWSVPEEYALVFRFDRPTKRGLHMLFVPFPIDAVWLVDDEVTAIKRLRPWIGVGRGRGDTVIELPAGGADGVDPGDELLVVE